MTMARFTVQVQRETSVLWYLRCLGPQWYSFHLSTSATQFPWSQSCFKFPQTPSFVKSLIQTSHSRMTTSWLQIICSFTSITKFLSSSGLPDNGFLYILSVNHLLLPNSSVSSVEHLVHNFNHPFIDALNPLTSYLANLQTWINLTKKLLVSWILLEKTMQFSFYFSLWIPVSHELIPQYCLGILLYFT